MTDEETAPHDPIGRLAAGARSHSRPHKTSECPEEDRLRMLVPGLVDTAEADKLLGHAAECDWCGAVLREAAQDLSGPPTDEEEEFARGAWLANADHRREFVERLTRHKRSAREARPRRWAAWWPLPVGLATAALVGGVWYELTSAGGAGSAERLLAEAYTKQREIEVRIPGAAYGQLRVQMGEESSRLNKPIELSEAIPKIQRGIAAHPNDPQWLDLKGRADLLEGQYQEAIVELEHARALQPRDATTLTDLGAAYFQKAAREDDKKAYRSAYDYFSEGANLKPGDKVLAFNKALAAERIYANNEAPGSWEAYLKMDPDSGWAAEARDHLYKVKKNLINSGTTPPAPRPKR
jgi:tetratricopeptide (TPR) repeat protein